MSASRDGRFPPGIRHVRPRLTCFLADRICGIGRDVMRDRRCAGGRPRPSDHFPLLALLDIAARLIKRSPQSTQEFAERFNPPAFSASVCGLGGTPCLSDTTDGHRKSPQSFAERFNPRRCSVASFCGGYCGDSQGDLNPFARSSRRVFACSAAIAGGQGVEESRRWRQSRGGPASISSSL